MNKKTETNLYNENSSIIDLYNSNKEEQKKQIKKKDPQPKNNLRAVIIDNQAVLVEKRTKRFNFLMAPTLYKDLVELKGKQSINGFVHEILEEYVNQKKEQ